MPPLLQPASEAWFAQNFQDALQAYDWVAPMTMPLMEGVSYQDAPQWLDRMVDAARQYPGAIERTIFELQARDWRPAHAQPIDSQTLADWMRRLQVRGARHLGYYPDDFLQNHPALEVIRPHMSTSWFPTP